MSPAPAGRIPPAILWGWLICGVLDITAAIIEANYTFDLSPIGLLQNVASALLGPAAKEGGLVTAALGLAMHFTVAFTWTTIFYLLSRRFPLLLRWGGVPGGLVFGALVFLVMFRGVIPLTIELKTLCLTGYVPPKQLPPLRLPQFVIHLVCVGLPIALAARWFAPRPATGDHAAQS
jgi:hypothetical protein